MTDHQELRDLLLRATDGEPPLDTDRLKTRLEQRRRRRSAGRAVAVLGSVALIALAVVGALPFLQGDGVELAETVAVTAFDPGEVSEAELAAAPTLLPAGAASCQPADHRLSGDPAVQTLVDDQLVQVSWFCAEETDIVLAVGPHASVPEDGDVVEVARRDGFVHRTEGLVTLTVSDANSIEDAHFRLITDESVAPQTLVEIMASIPAIARAPFSQD